MFRFCLELIGAFVYCGGAASSFKNIKNKVDTRPVFFLRGPLEDSDVKRLLTFSPQGSLGRSVLFCVSDHCGLLSRRSLKAIV